MKNRLISLLIILTMIIPLHATAEDGLSHLIDDCSDLSKTYSTSEGMFVTSARASLLLDGNVLAFGSGTKIDGLPYVVYKVDGKIENAELETYCLTSAGKFFSFEVSNNGKNWKTLDIEKNYNDYERLGLSTDNIAFYVEGTYYTWKKMIYNIHSLDSDYAYLKITFGEATGEAHIGKVDIGFSPMDIEYTAKDVPYDPAAASLKQESKEQKAYDFLNAINCIVSRKNPIMDQKVTRNDFAKDICHIAKIETGENAVESLAKAGYFAADGEYNENEELDVDFAIKLIVDLLGYAPKATALGGYPTGYRTIAENLKLYGTINKYDTLTLGDEVTLLKSALESEIMGIDSFTGENVMYSVKSGQTYLSEVMGIYKGNGIVNANSMTGLTDAEDGVPDDFIRIGEVAYIVSDKNYEYFLGYNTNFYYTDDCGIKEIVYIEAEERKNNILEVLADDILPDTTNEQFKYVEPGKQKVKTANIIPTADMIVNGVAVPFSVSQMIPVNGCVRLVDNDGDSKFDVVVVESYESIKIIGTEQKVSKILGYGNKRFEIKSEIYDYELLIVNSDMVMDESVITVGKVVSVAQGISQNKRFTKIFVGTESITGTVKGMEDNEIIIDGMVYKVSAECKNNINQGYLPQIVIGAYIDASIDAFGKIVYFKTKNTMYGFLRKIVTNSEDDVIMRIFTTEGKWENYYLKDKIKFNGTYVNKLEVKDLVLAANYGKMETAVRYKIRNGKLVEIETPRDLKLASQNERKAAIGQDIFRLMNSVDGQGYVPEVDGIAWSMYFTDDTEIIVIPEPARYDEEDMYAIKKKSELNNWVYPCSAYDTNEYGQVKFAIFTHNFRTYMIYKLPRMVTKIKHILDRDGLPGAEISTLTGTIVVGSESKFYDAFTKGTGGTGNENAYVPFESSMLKPGDMFYTVGDSSNPQKMDIVRTLSIDAVLNNPDYPVHFTAEDMKVVSGRFRSFSPDGTIMKFESITYSGGSSNASLKMLENMWLVYAFDGKVDVQKVSKDELKDGDIMLLRYGYNDSIRDIYIIRR